MLEIFKAKSDKFEENGFFIYDLMDIEPLEKARDSLKKQLKLLSKIPDIDLENYHLHFENDQKHYDMQYELLSFYRKNDFAQEIIKKNLDIFRFLLGPDLEIQREPYLRITRPNKNKDNIGFHRDTYYGTSPTEISIFIPFVNLTNKNTLSIFPKSHVYPDSHFTWKSTVNNEVAKNSKRHEMGFLYAPKVMSSEVNEKLIPQPLSFGQILVFMLSAIHGSIDNTELWSRWSTDIRIKHTSAKLSDTMKPNYYIELESSVVNKCHRMLTSNELQKL